MEDDHAWLTLQLVLFFDFFDGLIKYGHGGGFVLLWVERERKHKALALVTTADGIVFVEGACDTCRQGVGDLMHLHMLVLLTVEAICIAPPRKHHG